MNTDLTTKIPLKEHIKNIKKIMHIITDMDNGISSLQALSIL